MATTLLSEECNSAAEANDLFSTTEGLLILKPQRLCSNPLSFTIPSGCYALVSSRGVDLDYLYEDGARSAVWPAGLHFPYPPWYQISHLITKQSLIFQVPVRSCKTSDNVTVNIDVSITFRIMGDSDIGEDTYLVRKFITKLKASGLEQQLRGAQEAMMRALVRNMDHTSIYSIRYQESKSDPPSREQPPQRTTSSTEEEGEGIEMIDYISGSSATTASSRMDFSPRTPTISRRLILDEETEDEKSGENITETMKEALNDQFMPQGVEIISLAIKNVVLPNEVRSRLSREAVALKTREHERIKHLHAMTNTRQKEEMRGLLQTYDEDRQQEHQIALEQINLERVQLEDAIALTRKAEAEILEDARIKIESMQQKQSYEIQRIKDSSDAETLSTKRQAQLFSAQIRADTELEKQTKLSDARIVAEKNAAEASKIMAAAEGKIASWVKKRNKYNLSLQKIKNLEALADNDKVIISPSTNTEENVINVADSILHGGDESSELASVAAEIELLKRVAVVTPEKEEDLKKPAAS